MIGTLMTKGFLLAVGFSLAPVFFQTPPRRVVFMQALTVPANRLPAGCTLAPTPSTSRVLLGPGVPLPTNPWMGTDREYVISIRQSMMPATKGVPDAQPVDKGALTRYRAQLANGVEEAYAAVYTQSDESRVNVRAVRFATGEKIPRDTSVSDTPALVRVEIGSILALVSGSGACAQAVGAYLKSL